MGNKAFLYRLCWEDAVFVEGLLQSFIIMEFYGSLPSIDGMDVMGMILGGGEL